VSPHNEKVDNGQIVNTHSCIMVAYSTTELNSLDENEASPLLNHNNEIDSTSLHHALQWKLNKKGSVDSTDENSGNNNSKKIVS